jgi:general stress protein YciG
MTDETTTKTDGRSRRGFASMSPERRREIAARGGAAVKPENRSFSRNRALAAEAGSVGGTTSRKPKAGEDE